ncbi:MAG TPA: DUF1343 domain-containing protein [Gemmatimonadales bacterium]|jgi:uncharacterized protein YbbC (DUF1343 family)
MHRYRLTRVKGLLAFAVLAACHGGSGLAASVVAPRSVRPGIDVAVTDSIGLFRGKRVGLVTNVAAVDAHGVGDITRFRAAGINLVALFAPEHGLTESAAPGEHVGSSVDSSTHVPIYSLYGRTVAPTAEMLAGIDVIVVDLPDVGARYFSYLATTVEVMKAAAVHRIPVVILDRPNPLGGTIEGNILDTAFTSMVGRLAVPIRYGLTLGEEARLAASDLDIPVALTVVPVAGWHRSMLFAQTGLPFRAPSPNLQTLAAVQAYPGSCLFEGTALSVGRGTDAAYLQVGAPWLDTTAVLQRVRQAHLAGVTFRAVQFTPHAPGDKKFADTLVAGIRWEVTDPQHFDPVFASLTLLTIMQAVHPGQVKVGGSFDRLAGGKTLREAIVRGDTPAAIVATWRAGLEAYRLRARPFLLYGAL